MKITSEWLKEVGACLEGREWFESQKEADGVKVVKKLLKENHWDWANWAICRMFSKKNKVMYAIFAAQQVIKIYEKKYPDDKRPRQAIEAAQRWLTNPSEKNREAADADAADVAAAAADAAYAADVAAAAADAADVAADARNKLRTKIINYGIKLLEAQK